jgi:hypothetical protein
MSIFISVIKGLEIPPLLGALLGLGRDFKTTAAGIRVLKTLSSINSFFEVKGEFEASF